MTPQKLDSKFQQLKQELPTETEGLARKHKAFQRARKIKTVSALKQLAKLVT